LHVRRVMVRAQPLRGRADAGKSTPDGRLILTATVSICPTEHHASVLCRITVGDHIATSADVRDSWLADHQEILTSVLHDDHLATDIALTQTDP
jgi:hypothetical protein